MPDTVAAPAAAAPPTITMSDVRFNEDFMIPPESGQAVSRGWMPQLGNKPLGVTWHWTVTWNLAVCRQVLGGRNAERRGVASAHYGVGRSFQEGVDRYVSLENRSWHAGKGQKLRWDGRALGDPNLYKGSRSTVGVETITIGAAEGSIKPKDDWIRTATPDGMPLRVQPWTEEQIQMMIVVGQEIIKRWPHIQPRDHHGHHDICPGYKIDVAGFPFARVLRGIYGDPTIPDVWSPFETVTQRQRGLASLRYDVGTADGRWGPRSNAALLQFQAQNGLVPNGMWSTYVCRKMHEALIARGLDPAHEAGAPV
jgi:N-acetyl-anhydromuramyl-L-alanine amidase AmpD